MAQTYPCLASHVKEDDTTGFRTVTSKTGESRTKKITVKQALKKMRARCAGNWSTERGDRSDFIFCKAVGVIRQRIILRYWISREKRLRN